MKETRNYGSIGDPEPRQQSSSTPEVDGPWAWLIAASSLLIMMNVCGVTFVSGIISSEFIANFHLEQNVAKGSIPAAVLQGLYLIAGPVASVLCTRFGYRVVAVAGAVLAIGGFISASYAPNIELLTLTYGIISGIGFSFLFLASMVITTLYFNRWRSLAVGLASCGSGIGIFFYPQIVRTVLDRLDWHWCLQIQGAIMIVCLLAAFTFRPLTSGNGTESRTICEALASSFHIRLLKKPIFILLLLMAFLSTVGILIPFNYIPLTSLERNLTESQAAWLVSIMGATNTAGRVLVGAAAFKLPVHPFVFMIVVNALGAVGTFLSVWCKTFVLLAVYCGFFGIVFATDAVLCTIVLARTLGEENLSGSFGLFCLIRGVTGIIVTPVAGTLHDITGQYRASFFLAASALALLAILNVIALIVAKRQETRSYQIQEDIHGSE